MIIFSMIFFVLAIAAFAKGIISAGFISLGIGFFMLAVESMGGKMDL